MSLRQQRFVIALTAVLSACMVIPSQASVAGDALITKTYYVDPLGGSDSASGTSPVAPWRTLTKVSAAVLRPGDLVLLRRGATHIGEMTLSEDGTAAQRIAVRAYGTGSRPVISDGNCLTILGDYISVRGVMARDCLDAGISVAGARDTLNRVSATGNVRGVWIKPGATYATVSNSRIFENQRMGNNTPSEVGADDDWGAFGVAVEGDFTRITGNVISGHYAQSYDYGWDGSAVEIFQAIGTTVDHNVSNENLTFTELGGARSRDTVFAYNKVIASLSAGSFIITRGESDTAWGPVYNTTAVHNSVYLSGSRALGISCIGCSPRILSLSRNAIVVPEYGVGYADGAFESTRNIYNGETWFPLGETDSTVDVRFRNAPSDLSLRWASPAVDAVPALPGWSKDLAGVRVPQDGDRDGVRYADIGAFERR